jgi:hypothetical protein
MPSQSPGACSSDGIGQFSRRLKGCSNDGYHGAGNGRGFRYVGAWGLDHRAYLDARYLIDLDISICDAYIIRKTDKSFLV